MPLILGNQSILQPQMQQQFFKTMEPAFCVPKASLASKSAKTGSKSNNKSQKQFFQVDLTPDQVRTIQEKLPKGFFLFDPLGEELSRMRSEYKSSVVQKDFSSSKAQIIKSKKEQKKLEARERIANQNNEKKNEAKYAIKPQEGQKEKVMKKQCKTKVFRKQSQKGQGPLATYQDENQHSQQGYNDQINSIKVVEGERKKQKQKQKPMIKENKKEVIIKPCQPQQIEKQQIKQAVVLPQENQKYAGSNQIYQAYSIPTLPNNMQRHNPILSDAEIQGSIEENTLRYSFGLPFSGQVQQSIPKLNEKQKNFCINIIQRLKAHRSSQAFRVPVDPLSQGVPDYYYVVYTPMDLKTIEKKIVRQKYKNISQFHADINMIFLNSYKYNLRQTKYFEATIQFQDYYQQLLREALQKPEQYSKQYNLKNAKPKNDDQEDYNENNSKKQRSKKQISQSYKSISGNLTKSQIIEKNLKRRGQKLVKNKSTFDDQSGIFSHSLAMETVNDFHIQPQNVEFDKFAVKKEEIEASFKFRRVESVKMEAEEIQRQNQALKNTIQQQKQKQIQNQHEMEQQIDVKYEAQFNQKSQMIEQPKQSYTGQKHIQKPKRQRNKQKLAEQNYQSSHKKRNDDYNDDDYMQNNIGYDADAIQSLGHLEHVEDPQAISNEYNLLMSNKTQKNDIGMDIFDFGPFDGNNDNNLNDQSQGEDVIQAFKVEQKYIQQLKSIQRSTPVISKKIEKKPKKASQGETISEKHVSKSKHSHQQKMKKQPKLPPPPVHLVNQANTHVQQNTPATLNQEYQQVPQFPFPTATATASKQVQEPASIVHPLHPHSFEQSIIVNNINTHPQMYPPGIPAHLSMFNISPGTNFDFYTQNTEHPNSGATIALTSMSTAAYPKTTAGVLPPIPAVPPNRPIKMKKSKLKAKNSDEEYRCQSDDDYVVQSNRGKRKGDKKGKNKGQKQSSNSAQNNQGQKRRGRQPRRGNSDAGLTSQVAGLLAEDPLNKQGSSYHYPIMTRNKQHQQNNESVSKGGVSGNEVVNQSQMDEKVAVNPNKLQQDQKVERHIDPFAEIFENSKEQQCNNPSAQVGAESMHQAV